MKQKPPANQTISEKFIDQLYALNTQFTDENGKPVDIPASGFLGLLAAGYKGLVMLRKKKDQTHLYQKYTKGKKLVKRHHKQKNNK